MLDISMSIFVPFGDIRPSVDYCTVVRWFDMLRS